MRFGVRYKEIAMLQLMEKINELMEQHQHYIHTLLKQNSQLIGLVNDIRDCMVAANPADLTSDPPDGQQQTGFKGSDPEAYRPDELVTIKEAAHMLHISRWKVDDMRSRAELTSLEKNGRIRLIRQEIEAAIKWYSVPKGKI